MRVNGLVFDIQRFSVHDGPGIRTTVFLKGCSLRCLWCHNPESQAPKPELMYWEHKCIGCMSCVPVCPTASHTDVGGPHRFDRAGCIACGRCAEVCPAEALEMVGRTMTVAEVVAEVEKDSIFYESSGGGATISGGEPTEQPAFTRALLEELKARSIHAALETNGYFPDDAVEWVAECADLVLFDIKESDESRHRSLIGVGRKRIISNLAALSSRGTPIILRCPIVPGLNDRADHFRTIAALAEEHEAVTEVHVLPYHSLAEGKTRALGQTYELTDTARPDAAMGAKWIEAIAGATGKPVIGP